MRADMAKVVTESLRHGGRFGNRKFGGRIHRDRYDDDDHGQSGFIAHSRHRNRDCKEFSDLLGPLRKYLHKQVGRPWDKVYSELSQHLDKRSLSGQHIWVHVWQFVERHVYMDGRVARCKAVRFGREGMPVWGLYIHPTNGLLRCQKHGNRWTWY